MSNANKICDPCRNDQHAACEYDGCICPNPIHLSHPQYLKQPEPAPVEEKYDPKPVAILLTASIAAHEANRILCLAMGDDSQKTWFASEQWQRNSAVSGVRCVLENPSITPEQQHQAWCDFKVKEGWTYGPVKDAEKKEHPCLVPYAQLPEKQRLKDEMFGVVVRSVLGFPFTEITSIPTLEMEVVDLEIPEPIPQPEMDIDKLTPAQAVEIGIIETTPIERLSDGAIRQADLDALLKKYGGSGLPSVQDLDKVAAEAQAKAATTGGEPPKDS